METYNTGRNNQNPKDKVEINYLQDGLIKTGKQDEVIEIYDIKQVNKEQDSNGLVWDIFVARIIKYNPNLNIKTNCGDYIGFEIRPEVTKYLIQHPGLQKNLIGWLAYYYNREKDNDNIYNLDKFFLGQMMQGENGQYFPIKKNKYVKDFFDMYVDKQIIKIKQEIDEGKKDFCTIKQENELRKKIKVEKNNLKQSENER